MTYRVGDFLREGEKQSQVLATQIERGESLLSQHDTGREEVASRYNDAFWDLASAVLPTLSASAVDAAWHRTRCPALRENDPVRQMKAERSQLESELRQVETNPLYLGRSKLTDPNFGELTLALASAKEQQESLKPFLERAAHPRLDRLIESGYGTAAYNTGWWRWAYYADWKAGDEILEKVKDHQTFESFRTNYVQVRDADALYSSTIADSQKKLDEIKELTDRREWLKERISTGEARWLDDARDQIARYLSDLPDDAFVGMFKDDPALELPAKRCSGLRAQLTYLDEMGTNQLAPMVDKLQQQQAKLQSDMTRYSQPRMRKVQFKDDVFERRFRDRTDYYDGYWNRYSRGYGALMAFEDYERMRWTEDLLWWDLMTAGRLDGRYLPSVVEYRDEHPDYVFDRSILKDDLSTDADDTAAAAVAAEVGSDIAKDDVS